MPSPVTLRVDKETRLRIARIARRKQVSASEVIRQAIETWIEEQEPAGSPSLSWRHLLVFGPLSDGQAGTSHRRMLATTLGN
jgi:hypothetical protein